MSENPKPWRLPQIGLNTVFIIVTALCILFAQVLLQREEDVVWAKFLKKPGSSDLHPHFPRTSRVFGGINFVAICVGCYFYNRKTRAWIAVGVAAFGTVLAILIDLFRTF